MNDTPKLNDRLTRRHTDDDPDAYDDLGTFGYLRGVRDRGLMIEFRFASGNREAFAYTLLERVSYDPSVGITLKFMGTKVVIQGQKLDKPNGNAVSLLEAIERYRVPWVRESETGVNQLSIVIN